MCKFMLFSDAFAIDDGAATAPSAFANFVPLIIIFVVFYFFVIRPQQKKMKTHNNMLSSLKKGDTIVTNGGIIGTITKVKSNDSDILEVEISKGVKIDIKRSFISELKEQK